MRRLSALLLLACLLVAPSVGQPRDARVEHLLDRVNLDSLVHHVRGLSGEDTITVGDSTYLLLGRAGSEVPRYLREKLQGWGLDAEITYMASMLPDSVVQGVLGMQVGTGAPDEILILCAHFDTRGEVPGADDNASGVAVVLEAARLLAQQKTYYTVVYALWNLEELYLLGSADYATQASAAGLPIRAVVNLDMLGYDQNDDGGFEVHTEDVAESVALASTVQRLNDAYEIGLVPEVYNPGTGRSDHASFWANGYSAVLVTQQFWGGDFNAYYHTEQDRIEHFNLPYYHRMAKLAVASIAELALGLDFATEAQADHKAETGFVLEQNYPNPFHTATTIRYQLPRPGPVRLAVYDVLGREVAVLVDGEQGAGRHAVVSTLPRQRPSGMYLYVLTADGHTAMRRMLLVK